MLDWTRAKAEAAAITNSWADQAGPGGAVVIFDAERRLEANAGGFANLEQQTPFTADTPNRLASISKHFMAATLLLEGIALDAPLGSLLEGLPAAIAAVPLGRALDMTGALPDMMETLWQLGVPYTTSLSAPEIHDFAQRLPGINAVPGQEMAYSNTGWRLAQSVLPAQRSITYREALRLRLFGPLALPFVFPEDESEIVPDLATGYWHDGVNWRRGRYGFQFSASGGLVGSASALAIWASDLMAGRGPLAGVFQKLAAPRHFADGRESGYRLGLVSTQLLGTTVIGHGGSLTGYRNHFLMAPEHGVGVVVFSNREEEALWPALRVLAALLGKALPEAPAAGPTGLYISEEGSFWAELGVDSIGVMGGYERLVVGENGRLRSLPSYLDIELGTLGEDEIQARIGGVERRLLRVPAATSLDPRLIGRWRERSFGVEITVAADGTAQWPWAEPVGMTTRLTPLPGGRALADLAHGPWRHRPCVWLQPDGSLRLDSHRARVLQFDRVDEVGGTR
ncbi:putative beta-lactamase [Bosea sp. LC85]|uniref:serine hydrolase domain-containing protein n=1 Tax=Bosea sp. LC85 TaxID=1502851 RepID=UPI0004E33A28|nr:serine hydrolase domain-containing protein [Bosea sp. LC85]KFC75714.1 putative beta-lactamase [Bosea sp. LC85]